MISNKSKWKCNSGWYVHLYSFVYAAQQQGGYHPPFKLRGKLVLLLLLLGFEIFYQKPCRWFDPLSQCEDLPTGIFKFPLNSESWDKDGNLVACGMTQTLYFWGEADPKVTSVICRKSKGGCPESVGKCIDMAGSCFIHCPQVRSLQICTIKILALIHN